MVAMYRHVRSAQTRLSRLRLRLVHYWLFGVGLTLLMLHFIYRADDNNFQKSRASLTRFKGNNANATELTGITTESFTTRTSPAASVYIPKVQEIPHSVPLLENNVHIYSAIGRNSTGTSFWDLLALNGWEHKYNVRHNYTCCLRYNSSTILSVSMSNKLHWLYLGKAYLSAKQFVCPNPLHKQHRLPDGVSLVKKGENCLKNASLYVKPNFPLRVPNESISVCTKIAFGQLDASTIIEWFEVHKRMGVQKVITYTHQLNEAAMKALQYYVSSGIAELHPFGLPDTERFQRSIGVKNFQSWNDEQVPVFDCNARLAGYTYIGLIDMDEYVTPKKHSNWRKMLSQLRKDHPNAAGFTFKTEIYPSTWGKMDNETDISFAAYQNRTTPMNDRVKSIIITARTQPGRLSTHGYWPTLGYRFRKPIVPADMATLKHYRSCRKEWLKQNGRKCYQELERVTDKSMVKVAQMVKGDIRKIKEILGLHH